MVFHTLSDLKEYCVGMQLPLEKMRFSLGMNKGRSPRWFFIYRDITGEWVVAKNKEDGTTVERYRGFDESEAVRIIAKKMEEEANKRGLSIYRTSPEVVAPIEQMTPAAVIHPMEAETQDPWESTYKRRERMRKFVLLLTVILIFMGMLVIGLAGTIGKTIQFGSRGRGGFCQSDSPDYQYGYSAEDSVTPDDIPWWQLWIWDAYADDYDYNDGFDSWYEDDYWDDTYDDYHYYGYDDRWDSNDWSYDYDDGWNVDDWSDPDTDWDSGWDSDWSNDGWTDWDDDW